MPSQLLSSSRPCTARLDQCQLPTYSSSFHLSHSCHDLHRRSSVVRPRSPVSSACSATNPVHARASLYYAARCIVTTAVRPRGRAAVAACARPNLCHSALETAQMGPASAAAPASGERVTPIEELGADAVVWATQHGLLVGAGPDAPPAAVMHAPLSVLPAPFPEASFHKAVSAAAPFNTLIAAVAADSAYLQETLAPAAEFDDFTARLLQMHRETEDLRAAGKIEQLVLAINRSDYMLDEPSNTLMQVELNTIASSFGALSAIVSRMHGYTLSRSGRTDIDASQLPENRATEDIAEAMAAGAALVAPNAVMLMVVQPGEQNSYDQQWLQTTLWERHRVRTVRRTLEEIASDSCVQLSPEDGTLHVDGWRVGVVYLRAGYSPDDYPSEVEWQGRGKLERSSAVKCPSVAFQLAGAKKVQQDLARPGVLERFVTSRSDAELLRACFAGLWGLDDLEEASTAEVLEAAAEDPDAYVLKPQREGGGNNLYGEQAAEKIAARKGLAAYILMQRIRPPIHTTAMVRKGEVIEVEALSELGVFGTYLSRHGQVLLNKQAGHLLRTKAATSDEGGVAAGFAVLDSPYLTD